LSFEKTWSGDWYGRILERVHERGFETVTQYAGQHPGVDLIVLADELGPDDVAAAQIRSILVQEAIRTRTVPRALRDLFVRELRRSLPQGWNCPLDDESRSEVAGALARWQTELEVEDHLDCFDDDLTFSAGQDVLNAEFPTGWLPEGPDDPVIIAFVDRCLGRVPS
jgi:hypothetical protein